jgi:hypothetical protein
MDPHPRQSETNVTQACCPRRRRYHADAVAALHRKEIR